MSDGGVDRREVFVADRIDPADLTRRPVVAPVDRPRPRRVSGW